MIHTINHCRTLRAKDFFWFTSALIYFPRKHSCYLNDSGKYHGDQIGQKETIGHFFNL